MRLTGVDHLSSRAYAPGGRARGLGGVITGDAARRGADSHRRHPRSHLPCERAEGAWAQAAGGRRRPADGRAWATGLPGRRAATPVPTAAGPTRRTGIRRYDIQRADHTEEPSYGSSVTGGFDATDFARRTDQAAGDITAAVHQWLVETDRIHPDACPSTRKNTGGGG
ncbi:hypothetical protein GCM10010274_60130 [Streptomyces lavendofoliae]|uniref:Uncharacterized protein n=1 Tax=Streptomyces lavendofoliae TaxID=67314 RepID=A0A918I542_9ACTN|nr:hypothetical protein GCM10010274_60130 [Streptomyces lavendofoliae]